MPKLSALSFSVQRITCCFAEIIFLLAPESRAMDGKGRLSFVSLCIALCAGLGAAVFSPALLSYWALLCLGVVVCGLLYLKNAAARLLALFLIGVIWSTLYCHHLLASLLPYEQENQEQAISGYVLDFPQQREFGWSVDFYAEELSGKIKLSFSGQEKLQTRCVYHLTAKLKRPRGLNNFGLFDRQAWLLQSGYLATGSVRSVLSCDGVSSNKILYWREKIAAYIKSVTMSDYARSTLLALLIGSYADIDVTQWQLLRESGTIHLLSVSGLHIVLAAWIAYFCFFHLSRYLVRPVLWMPAAHWGGIAALSSSIAYALLAGFSVPTQRSLVMVAVVVLQRFLYNSFTFATAFMLALLLVLLTNPLSLFLAGFWFSFLATGFLLLISLGRIGRSHWFIELIRPQWLIFLLMAPPLLYAYGRMPVLSLPMNLFAVPWISFLSLPLAFAGLLLMPLSSFLASWCFRLSAWTLDVYWRLVEWSVALCRDWMLNLGGVSLWSVSLAMLGLCLWLLPRSFPLRPFSVLLCLPLFFPAISKPLSGNFEATVLDVGQGLSVVVRTASHVLVYDTGDNFSERFDSGRDIVAPFLRNHRIDTINMLMLSHSDKDHAGGATGLLQDIHAQQLWSGTPELLRTAEAFNQCRGGMHWRWDDVDFRVLAPLDNLSVKTNNRSCVLLIDNGRKRLLLTGDAEKDVEQSLIASGVNVSTDVLLVPHHGSKTSSSPGFIDAVSPRLAIVSSGFMNRFHHPNANVMARYHERNIPVLNTAEHGAIRIDISANLATVDSVLCQKQNSFVHRLFAQQHFWQEIDVCRQQLPSLFVI